MKHRRLTANPGENPVDLAVISRDGKYLAYSDDSGIGVKLIATGEIQTISRPQALLRGRDSWFPTAWFPNSSRLVANLIQSGEGSIWTVLSCGVSHVCFGIKVSLDQCRGMALDCVLPDLLYSPAFFS